MTQIHSVVDDLYSGGQPSEAELAMLARKGVRTIINLRHPSEVTDFEPRRLLRRACAMSPSLSQAARTSHARQLRVLAANLRRRKRADRCWSIVRVPTGRGR